MLAIDPLPIDSFIATIARARCRQSRAVVVTAQPGAGKTTRVPPALIDDGPVILLQPRRVAARAIAQRIADERGWTIGREVGWQVRFERRFGRGTRLLVVTEGILTARLQQDPLLSEFRTIVLDEFHERSIHADLAIALAKAGLARPRRSAHRRHVGHARHRGGRRVSRRLPGRRRARPPVSARHQLRAGDSRSPMPPRGALGATTGDVLCFLPGAFEIRRAVDEIARAA